MSDNLKIWNAVSKTNPANTKQVNQRGGFTSIDAHSQVMAATEQFGPIGIGWGYTATPPIFQDRLLFIDVTLWHGDRANTYGPMLGGAEWQDKNGRLDSDAGKKATTDALTKLLSQLGFNADVFLRKFDDNKYVQQMAREFAEKERASEPLLSEEQRQKLSEYMNGLNFPADRLLSVSKIKDLRELPAAKFDGAMKWIADEAKKLETQNA